MVTQPALLYLKGFRVVFTKWPLSHCLWTHTQLWLWAACLAPRLLGTPLPCQAAKTGGRWQHTQVGCHILGRQSDNRGTTRLWGKDRVGSDQDRTSVHYPPTQGPETQTCFSLAFFSSGSVLHAWLKPERPLVHADSTSAGCSPASVDPWSQVGPTSCLSHGLFAALWLIVRLKDSPQNFSSPQWESETFCLIASPWAGPPSDPGIHSTDTQNPRTRVSNVLSLEV